MTAKAVISLDSVRKWATWLLLAALSGSAWAQAVEPAPATSDHGKAGGLQQRRAALRAALQAQRDAQAPKPEPLQAARQLTPGERAKLREQLRQQRRLEPGRGDPPDRNSQTK